MKILFTSLVGLLLLCSCTKTPTAPQRPHQTNYVVEVLEVSNTSPVKLDATKNKAEQLILHPDSEIYAYPMLFAPVGKPAIVDSTKTVPLIEDYDIIEDKVIPRLKDVRLGRALTVTIAEVNAAQVRYTIKLYYKQLIDHETYPVGRTLLKLPVFKSWTIDTEVTQPPAQWNILGGVFGADNNRFVCVRITPPISRASTNDENATP